MSPVVLAATWLTSSTATRRKALPRPSVVPVDAPFLPGTVLDQIAPSDVELRPDAIVVESLPSAGLAVAELPRTVVPSWLRAVCQRGLPFDLTFLIRPISALEDAASLRLPIQRGARSSCSG